MVNMRCAAMTPLHTESKKLDKMERLQFDISQFIRTPDGVKLYTNRPPSRLKMPEELDSIPKENAKEQSSSTSLVSIFLIITLIVIAITLLIYIYNKGANSTKEIINRNIKENGKS